MHSPIPSRSPTGTLEPGSPQPGRSPVAWSRPQPVGAPAVPDPVTLPAIGGWQAVVLPATLRDVQFDHVAWTGSRFLARGRDERGHVFASSRDGIRWARIKGSVDPDPFSPAGAPAGAVDAARAGSRWVAVGTAWADGPCASTCEADRGLVWMSGDGRTWTRVGRQSSLDGAVLNTVARIGTRWVAAGSKGSSAAAWTSPDGRTWTRAGKDAFARDRTAGIGVVTDLVVFDGVLVAGGMDGGQDSSTARTWWSTDGSRWREARMDRVADGQVLSVTDAGPELLAVGPSGACTGGVWASVDGRSWTCVGSGKPMRQFGPSDAAASSRVEVLVGLTGVGWDEDSGHGLRGAIFWRALP